VEQHNQEKARMIEEEKKQHFSYDVLITLTEEEKKANEKLKKLKDIWATPLYNVVL
jgi:adenosine deaminase CECR1